MKEKKVIEEITLIRNIIKYIIIDDPKPDKENKISKLEEEIQKTKIKKTTSNLGFLEEVLSQLKQNDSEKDFSVDIKKEREKIEKAQSLVIKYNENQSQQKLTIETDDGKQKYSFDIVKEKTKGEKPYELSIVYENKSGAESLKVNYNLRDYPIERELALQDFTNQLDKTLHIMPKSIMGGVLGYTYLGENFMARRDDLTGDMAKMVDVHEAIHTPDEYETRVLTSWMLKMERGKYKR